MRLRFLFTTFVFFFALSMTASRVLAQSTSPTPRPTICPVFSCAAPRFGCTYQRVAGQCGCGTLICASPRPSIRPTLRPTPSPTPRPSLSCNKNCGYGGSTCAAGLVCYQPPQPPCPSGHVCAQMIPQRVCRNPSCVSSLTCGCTVSPAPSATPSVPPVTAPVGNQLPGDANNDGVVDIFDYNIVVADFGYQGNMLSDVTHDGVVDIFDYNLVIAKFGTHR